MVSGQGIDELSCDAHPVASFLNTPLQHVANPQILGHLLNLCRFTLVGKGGVSGDHKKAISFGEAVDDPLRQAVTEILLFFFTTQIGKGLRRQ